MTAVEWLVEEFEVISNSTGISKIEKIELYNKAIEQAKEMYKEQLIEFADEYEYECTSYKGRTMSPEEFYSYIFKSE